MRALDAAPAPRAGTAALRRPGGSVSDLRYLLTGRIIPAVLYALLGYGVVQHAIWLAAHLTQVTWLTVIGGPIREALFGAFCLIPVVLFVVRPKPRAADGRVLPRLVAFAGTAILLVLGTGIPEGMRLLSIPGLGGIRLLARPGGGHRRGGLGAADPAALLRHLPGGAATGHRRPVPAGAPPPLPLRDRGGAGDAGLGRPPVPARSWSPSSALLQVTRIRYEESLLRRTLPRVEGWAAGRARLIPGVW